MVVGWLMYLAVSGGRCWNAGDGGSCLDLVQLTTSPLNAQQQPDKLVLEFLLEVELVASSQFCDQFLRVLVNTALQLVGQLRQTSHRQTFQT